MNLKACFIIIAMELEVADIMHGYILVERTLINNNNDNN